MVLVAGLLVIVAKTFKIEEIKEVCSLTGTSQRYNTYFSVFSTRTVVTTSWIEDVLKEKNQPVPKYDWVRTMGNTRTILTVSFVHSRAPITYSARSWNLEFLRESHTDAEILELAKAFASGDPERQKDASNQLFSE